MQAEGEKRQELSLEKIAKKRLYIPGLQVKREGYKRV